MTPSDLVGVDAIARRRRGLRPGRPRSPAGPGQVRPPPAPAGPSRPFQEGRGRGGRRCASPIVSGRPVPRRPAPVRKRPGTPAIASSIRATRAPWPTSICGVAWGQRNTRMRMGSPRSPSTGPISRRASSRSSASDASTTPPSWMPPRKTRSITCPSGTRPSSLVEWKLTAVCAGARRGGRASRSPRGHGPRPRACSRRRARRSRRTSRRTGASRPRRPRPR